MIIEKFTKKHIEAASKLALLNYREERAFVPSLPEDVNIPNLTYFAENGLGVAAMEGDELVGYLCVYEPWEGAFDMYDDKGTFSPTHAHGAAKENRVLIYQRMFEEAAREWHSQNILAYGVSLYAHDLDARQAFWEYGFGCRCMDEIRELKPIGEIINKDCSLAELPLEEFKSIRNLRTELDNHLKHSPCFMQFTKEELEGWLENVEKGDRRTFVARIDGDIVAYLDVAKEGENFVTYRDDMVNIQGAYCAPAYRGRGIIRDLLEFVIETMASEGYRLLGVDHESYNPTALHFWPKHFTPYTTSVTRRTESWATR